MVKSFTKIYGHMSLRKICKEFFKKICEKFERKFVKTWRKFCNNFYEIEKIVKIISKKICGHFEDILWENLWTFIEKFVNAFKIWRKHVKMFKKICGKCFEWKLWQIFKKICEHFTENLWQFVGKILNFFMENMWKILKRTCGNLWKLLEKFEENL